MTRIIILPLLLFGCQTPAPRVPKQSNCVTCREVCAPQPVQSCTIDSMGSVMDQCVCHFDLEDKD